MAIGLRLFLGICLIVSLFVRHAHSESVQDLIEDIEYDVHIKELEKLKDLSATPDDDLKELGFLDKTHNILSHSVIGLSDSIDSLFGNERIDEEDKRSRLKFNFTSSLVEGQGFKNRFRTSLRLVFPRLEKKLALVVKDISDSFKQEDGDEGQSDLSDATKETGLGTYLHWFTAEERNFRLNNDAGVRFISPLDPFVRMRLRKSWYPSMDFELRLTGNIFWFKSKGFGHRWRFEADRKVSEKYLFRFDNQASWVQRDGFFNFSHGPVIFHKINSKNVISYGSAVESTSHSVEVQNYKAYVGYRSQFYQDWLYIEIQPEVNYPREREFRLTPILHFKIETVFGRFKKK